MINRTRREDGLTILEALIAIAVIGIVFAALAAVQVSNLRVTAASRDDSTVLQAAVQGFEVVRSRVLEDFTRFADECPQGSQAEVCTGALTGANPELPVAAQDPRVAVTYSIVSGVNSPTSTTAWLVRVDVTSVIDGIVPPFVLRQFVSCLDAVVPPTMTSQSVACGSGS